MPTETHLKILKQIASNPHISQRQLAEELGVSVGKVNYCVKALIDKGWVKAGAFLYAITSGRDYSWALAFANTAAARVVSQFGPRINSVEYDRLKAQFQIN
jgi:predicted transcriptional regulator